MTEWYRIDNFAEVYREALLPKQLRGSLYITRRVEFRYEEASLIKSISVTQYSNQSNKIHLKAPQYFFDTLASICTSALIDLQDNSGFRIKTDKDLNTVIVEFDNDNFPLSFLKDIFARINKKQKRDEFSQQIIDEINNIASYYKTGEPKEHLVPEYKLRERDTKLNPTKEQSTNLVDLIDKSNTISNKELKEIKELIVAGEDTNQFSKKGESALCRLIIKSYKDATSQKNAIRALKLLLLYKANVFIRDHSHFNDSPFEIATEFKKKATLETICNFFSGLKREPKYIKVDNVEMNVDENKTVNISLDLNDNKTLFICTKKTSDLTEAEIDCLFEIYQVFEIRAEEKSSEASKKEEQFKLFKKELAGANKRILMISDEYRIFGFTIVNLLKLDEYNDHIFANFTYAAALKEYRSLNIMSLLTFAPLYALKWLTPHLHVAYYATVISDVVYSWFKDLIHFPMHQTDEIIRIVNLLLKHDFEADVTVSNNPDNVLTKYVKESVALKEQKKEGTAETTNIRKEHFEKEILGKDESTPSTESRSTPVYCYADKPGIIEQQKFFKNLNINFIDFTKRYAKKMAEAGLEPDFLAVSKVSPPCNEISAAYSRFWNLRYTEMPRQSVPPRKNRFAGKAKI